MSTPSNPLNPSTWYNRTPKLGVPYRLVDVNAEFTYQDGEAVWSIIIPADRLTDFRYEMFPPPDVTKLDAGIGEIPRPSSMFGDESLVATKIAVRGFTSGKPTDVFRLDTDAPAGTYQQLLALDVTFSSKSDTDYLEIRSDGSGEFLTLPQTEQIRYNPTNEVSLDQIKNDPETFAGYITTRKNPAITVMVPMVKWQITFKDIPYKFYFQNLLPLIRLCVGKVNALPMQTLSDAEPETILFLNWDSFQKKTRQVSDQYGEIVEVQKSITLTLNFAEKRVVLREPQYFGGVGKSMTNAQRKTFLDSIRKAYGPAAVATQTIPGSYGGHNHYYIPGKGWKRVSIKTDTDKPVYEAVHLDPLITFISPDFRMGDAEPTNAE